ncbi:hypothetical protein LZ30DRAFT_595392 [Colletotrichum cereale]|nr:hypothetical protein LZ30DRAFT_595392 [Colletotrichum cereale]
MAHTVRSFNALPRPKTTPTGLPNHWVFGIRHVPIAPEEDIVVVAHPLSRYILSKGPARILSLPSASDKAKVLVPLLLDAFVTGHGSGGAPHRDPEPFAPWKWGVDDPELAAATVAELRHLGVKDALCSIEECSAGDKEILDDSRCHGCGSNRESFTEPLKKCSACGQAWYHSQDCQRQHWKRHKKACLANRSGDNRSSANELPASIWMEACTYYNQVARKSPDTQPLLRSLRLDPASNEGTPKLLRRLVIAGQDSTENIQRLFGPSSLSTMMKEDHENARLEVLLDPPRGSPSYNFRALHDDPSLTRSVRPPTEAEQQRLQEVRDMQQRIRDKVGAGKSPSSDDMKSILTTLGPEWPTKLSLYMMAANTMDQGVNRRAM